VIAPPATLSRLPKVKLIAAPLPVMLALSNPAAPS
jgi:hypothetical protein